MHLYITKQYYNTLTKACEACPTSKPYWDGTECTVLSTWCGNQLKNVGLISDGTGTVQANRIVATSGYYNYGVTVNAKIVYAKVFQ